MTVVDFFDHNIIDSLVLVNSLKPDRFIVIANREEENIKSFIHLLDAVKHLCENIEVQTLIINPRDLAGSAKQIKELQASIDDEIYLNIDSAHGISIAAGYGCGGAGRQIPVCVDMASSTIMNLRTLTPITDIKNISLLDYLNAIGAKRVYQREILPSEDEYDKIVNMAEVLFENVGAWNDLCGYIGKNYDQETMIVKIEKGLGGETSKRRLPIIRKQINAFCENDFFRKVDEDEDGSDIYEFTSETHMNYMVVFGVWLELYIFIKIQPYFDEVHTGFVIDWNGLDEYDTKDNEIDVIAMKNSRPILISCKMRMPTKEDIYEIGYIADVFGGRYAKAAVATTSILDKRNSKKPGVYSRFRKMNVSLIETNAMKKRPLNEILKCFDCEEGRR